MDSEEGPGPVQAEGRARERADRCTSVTCYRAATVGAAGQLTGAWLKGARVMRPGKRVFPGTGSSKG